MMPMARTCLHLAFAVVFAALSGSAWAQGPEPTPEISEFWIARERSRPGSAAALVGLGSQPWQVAAHRLVGKAYQVWADEFDVFIDRAPALNEKWLSEIKDNNAMPRLPGNLLPNEIPEEVKATYNLFGQAVVLAFQTPPEAFAKSAEENRDIFFSHLWNTPQLNRGKVVTVKGKMLKLTKVDAPLNAQKDGVRHVYEGWVFGPTRGATPYCIVFPTLPKGLQPAEKMREDVVFHGYFIKKMKYRDSEGKDRVSPLLIGPTVTLAAPAAVVEETTPFAVIALIAGAILIGVITLALVLMHRWFHRGDDRVRSQVVNIQAQHTMEAMEEAERGPPAVAPLATRPMAPENGKASEGPGSREDPKYL